MAYSPLTILYGFEHVRKFLDLARFIIMFYIKIAVLVYPHFKKKTRVDRHLIIALVEDSHGIFTQNMFFSNLPYGDVLKWGSPKIFMDFPPKTLRYPPIDGTPR